MDENVIYQPFLSEEKHGRQETSHLLGPHVICGTCFPGVSEIFPLKRLSFSKTSLIKFCPFTRINPSVLCLVTHLTDMVADQIPYVTTIETELLDKN